MFWASAEVFQAAFPALEKTRRCVERFFNAAFGASSIVALQDELRYTAGSARAGPPKSSNSGPEPSTARVAIAIRATVP